jgi:hypothetical protein
MTNLKETEIKFPDKEMSTVVQYIQMEQWQKNIQYKFLRFS